MCKYYGPFSDKFLYNFTVFREHTMPGYHWFWHYIAHLRQECHNSKFGIFELLVKEETFADTLLTGIVS